MEINDRIALIITDLDINPSSFAQSLGVKSAVIHNIIKGRRSKPSYELIQKILIQFAVSTEWLINGTGKMWLDSKLEIKQIDIVSLEMRIMELIERISATTKDQNALELAELSGVLMMDNKNLKVRTRMMEERYNKLVDTLRSQLKIKG